MDWHPESWHTKPALQQPTYKSAERLQEAVQELSRLPPLVTSWEVEELKSQLAEAARGERFLLQGGDCAETFDECNSPAITSKLKILLQMSLVLVHGLRRRVIRVGRFAGQYAKPRSSDNETRDGVTLPCYRGDCVNRLAFTPEDREPDPRLLVRGYERAALTLNFIRSLIDGGFADLHHPEYWDLAFVEHSEHAVHYQRIVESIGESLRFMETLAGTKVGQMERVDFFTSHEGLILPYEQAQTRRVPHRDGWYDLSTHMPWIGLRTADPGGAHVEFFRGIRNPVGVKVGTGLEISAVLRLIEILDPKREPGRLTLIHRYGAASVARELPPLIEAVERTGHRVVWCCDPMHGNTRGTAGGRKTRRFDDIYSELEEAIGIHERIGSILGGVHFELTGEAVTECLGGARGLSEVDLARDYRTQVDPRLNYEQALEIAMLLSRRLGQSADRRAEATRALGNI
jgi:3-deoxy-7-phosphoheptulonate synthase